jgi:hypothetical protein
MTVVSSNNIDTLFIDHDTGRKVTDIIGKYANTELSEETCDLVIEDIRAAFGENISAKVMIDTDVNDIEVIIQDKNDRFMRCSLLESSRS